MLAAGGGGAWLGRMVVATAWSPLLGPGASSAAEILTALATGGAVILAGWLWVLMLVELRRWAPSSQAPAVEAEGPALPGAALARRLIWLALGISVATMGPIAAQAVPLPSPTAVTATAELDPGFWPSDGAPSAPADSPSPSPSAPSPASPSPTQLPGPTPSDAAEPSPSWSTSPTVAPAPTVSPTPGAVAVDPAFTPTPDLSFLPPPPRVRDVPSPLLQTPASPSGSTAHTHVVLRGDTLWSIAARFLPPGATDAEIAAAWPAWHDANHDTIGPDPHLLLPGQILTAPTAPAATTPLAPGAVQ